MIEFVVGDCCDQVLVGNPEQEDNFGVFVNYNTFPLFKAQQQQQQQQQKQKSTVTTTTTAALSNTKNAHTVPDIIAPSIDDVAQPDADEKLKNKERHNFAAEQGVKKTVKQKKPLTPKSKKKQAKIVEKAIAMKDKTDTRVEKGTKKDLFKKRWNSLY
ncbi:hypothetical protein DFA_01233 [Cavenderia fasciculata]|uniref:Uncharacterized protein n=1 Tax=Cavenderia fasciculata TaxID=261658 RepID=F4PRL2_CACFS|nr:uncharacterized protein DFA_01233 [Cavenderia fasciculata]EGG21352.1 hypothetical protein DFA_01233 [Cavenderia fasciculata]|eukprot:XP_004359202.1 hypothetical protein DFA_01233 [Cavenderia fasciculata]